MIAFQKAAVEEDQDKEGFTKVQLRDPNFHRADVERTNCTFTQHISPHVNWLILGSKLSGSLLPVREFDSGFWLPGQLTYGKRFWLVVDRWLTVYIYAR